MKTSQKYVYDIGAGGLKNTKTGKVNIFNEENSTDAELYQPLQNDPARYVEIMTHKFDGTKKPKNYPKEITRIVKVEKPKKPKPKPIPLKPKPTIQE